MKRYIAADENGDIFIFSERPVKHDTGKHQGYWSCKGEEDVISRNGYITSYGRLLGLNENEDHKYDYILNLTFDDNPLEITLNIN